MWIIRHSLAWFWCIRHSLAWFWCIRHSLAWLRHSRAWLRHSLTWLRHSLVWLRHSLAWLSHSLAWIRLAWFWCIYKSQSGAWSRYSFAWSFNISYSVLSRWRRRKVRYYRRERGVLCLRVESDGWRDWCDGRVEDVNMDTDYTRGKYALLCTTQLISALHRVMSALNRVISATYTHIQVSNKQLPQAVNAWNYFTCTLWRL